MKIVFLATGDKEKLWPLSETRPSAMVSLVNRPVMSYMIELVARQGHKQIVVILHKLAAIVEGHFKTGERYGVQLNYILQREFWGTAGALLKIKRSLTETILVLPTDIILDLDIQALVQHHQAAQAAVTAVRLENSTTATGAYLLEPRALDFIPPRCVFDMNNLIEVLQRAGETVSTFSSPGYWNPLETLQHYFDAQKSLLNSSFYKTATDSPAAIQSIQVSGFQAQPGIWIGRNHHIAPNAKLTPPVVIGENCRIGPAVELGPNAVVGDNVVIDRETSIKNSAIFDNTYIGQMMFIDNRLVQQNQLIDLVTNQSVLIPDPLLIGSVPTNVMAPTLTRLFDLAIAGLLLLVSLPILIIIGLLALVGCGRVFERVEVVGTQIEQPAGSGATGLQNLRLFHFATHNRQGKMILTLIHRLQMHRLPELLNVLRGELRAVGVKPLLPEDALQITEGWQKTRNLGKPGLTGLWYINNDDSTDLDLDSILVADAYYVTHQNWKMDWFILWQTFNKWLHRSVNRLKPEIIHNKE